MNAVEHHKFVVLASQVIENPVTGQLAFITSFPDVKNRVNIYDLGDSSFYVLMREHLERVQTRREVTEIEWNLPDVYNQRGDRVDESLMSEIAIYLGW